MARGILIRVLVILLLAIIGLMAYYLLVTGSNPAAKGIPWTKPGMVFEYSDGYTYIVKSASEDNVEMVVVNETANGDIERLKYLIGKLGYKIINIDPSEGYLYFVKGIDESSIIKAFKQKDIEIKSIKLIADISNNYSKIVDSEIGVRKVRVYSLELGGENLEGEIRIHVDRELKVIVYIEGLMHFKKENLSVAIAVSLMRYYTIDTGILN